MQKCRIGESYQIERTRREWHGRVIGTLFAVHCLYRWYEVWLNTFTENKTDCTSSLSYYILDNLLLIRIRPSEPRASASVSASANFLPNILFV